MTAPPRLDKQYFFEDPLVDALINSITGLAMEISVVRERLDTLERALDDEGIPAATLIEKHDPDQGTKRARSEARLKIIKSALDPLGEHFSNQAQQNDKTAAT